MKSTRSCRPQVEGLESIALLSVAGAGASHAAAIVSRSRLPASRHPLAGSVSGTFSTAIGIPDAGATQNLVGNGKLKTLRNVQVQGSLHLTGFILSGHATGTLTLANSHGSVTLALTGPSQPGFSGPPPSFTFTIASATGRYQGLHGSGQVDLQENSGTSRFTLKIVPNSVTH